jgi:hypothetical protein
MLLKGADTFWWHKRRSRQEGYEFKYINEIYQIVTYSFRGLMATGF